jgi:DNA repair photolyase
VSPGPTTHRGRGATGNPPNRFESRHYEHDPEAETESEPSPATQFIQDHSQSIITHNDSPDIPFAYSLNPYRGCEHGCAYCYARPTHEYLGYSAGLDFESRILIKENAPELLRRELASPRWRPEVLAMSGVTDPYQPIERKLQLTRRCLMVLAECRHPVSLVTKNHLVTRDLDLLQQLHEHKAVMVCLSITSLDAGLVRRLEPRSSSPRQRLAAIEQLTGAGIPVGVLVAPIIPGLTDHEMPAILKAAAQAGARWAGSEIVRLPLAVAPLFEAWLEQHEPLKKDKILNRIRDIRGGRLNDPRFGFRMSGEGNWADQIHSLFNLARDKNGLRTQGPELSVAGFRRPAGPQLELF